MSWFTTGYQKVQEVGKAIDERLNQQYLPTLFLKDGEEAPLTFLTTTPFNYYEHFVKGINQSYTCSQSADCPLCAMGNKPSFKGAYIVIDHRVESWNDKSTGEVKSRKDTVKVMKQGIRALQVLDRKNARKGLNGRTWVLTRTGQGNNTQYDFEDIDQIPFTKPEKLPDLVEILKPKDRAYVLQKLAEAGRGAPASPLNIGGEEDEGVISFR